MLLKPIGFNRFIPGGGGGGFSVTLIANQNIGTTSTAASTSSNSWGAGDQVAVILDYIPDPGASIPSSVTIAGQAATLQGTRQDVGGFISECWVATVASGASGVVTVTPASGELGQLNVVSARISGGAFKAFGRQSIGAEFTQTVSLATAAGDLAFASASYLDTIIPSSMQPASMSRDPANFIQPTDPQNYFASVSTSPLTAGTTNFVMGHPTEAIRHLSVALFEAV